MGMAASQARFLGLTARKSNVEYQGQQINQQRTALSNESANLYNEMMQLNVPTPPATSDYYTTSYVLEGSSDDYAKSDYKLGSIVKTYEHQNEYRVTLITNREYYQKVTQQYKLGQVTEQPTADGSGKYYTIPLSDNGTGRNTNIVYNPQTAGIFTADDIKGVAAETNTIYAVGTNAEDLGGFKEAFPELFEKPEGADENWSVKDNLYAQDEEGNNIAKYYFYRDANGNNKFLTLEDLNGIMTGADGYQEGEYVGFSTANKYTKDETIQVVANLETSDSTGRYSTIQIDENPDYPTNLQGKIFSLTTVQEYDQNGYDDAYNDYEYQKGLYEKSISDINAKTEVIQNEDQQLELRLQQLNTEQNAISTEMDSVSKVIDDNVEKTFKVFA